MKALQMRISEPKRVPRQGTSVFETSNFSTPLYDKRPLRDGNIMERNQSALHQNNLIVRHIRAP